MFPRVPDTSVDMNVLGRTMHVSLRTVGLGEAGRTDESGWCPTKFEPRLFARLIHGWQWRADQLRRVAFHRKKTDVRISTCGDEDQVRNVAIEDEGLHTVERVAVGRPCCG